MGFQLSKKKVSNDTFFYIWLKNQQFLGKVEGRVQLRYSREVNMLPYMPSQCAGRQIMPTILLPTQTDRQTFLRLCGYVECIVINVIFSWI